MKKCLILILWIDSYLILFFVAYGQYRGGDGSGYGCDTLLQRENVCFCQLELGGSPAVEIDVNILSNNTILPCTSGCITFQNQFNNTALDSLGFVTYAGVFNSQIVNAEYITSITLPDLSTLPPGAVSIATFSYPDPVSCPGTPPLTIIDPNPPGTFTYVPITLCHTFFFNVLFSSYTTFDVPFDIQVCHDGAPDGTAIAQNTFFSTNGYYTSIDSPVVCYYNFLASGIPVSCPRPYDPNIKIAYPAGCGPKHLISANTDSILYHIIFRNEGAGYANNVQIIDTLPAGLNIDSVRVLYTSASKYRWEVTSDRALKVYLDSAFVPPAAIDSAGSYGYISFSAKLLAGLTPGTEIRNRAYIYFDSNPAIITPDVFHTIQDSPAKVVVVPCSALCEGDSVLLTAQPAGGSYVWSNGATTQSIWVHSTGTYTVSAIYPYTCQPSADSCTVAVAETLHSGVARKTYNPGTWYDVSFSLAKSVYVEVPAELPVILGNAGNHRAWLYITDSMGNKDTITYRGGSSQAHPVGSVQIAKGLKYHFNKGSNGLVAGSIVDAVAVRLRINGSWRHGETNVALTLKGSCSPPIGKADSRQSSTRDENSIEMPGISIYPNPATGNLLWVEWSESEHEHSLLEIYDVTGKLMIQTNAVNELDISGLAKGMYVLKLGKSSVRLIRE